MKKVVLIVGILLLLCCCCALLTFGLFGYFHNNNQCVYKGPLSTVSEGPCASSINKNTNQTNPDNTQDIPDQDTDQNTSELKVYDNGRYSFEYPSTFQLDETHSQVDAVVFAENKSDNINFLAKDQAIIVDQTTCEIYAQSTIEGLSQHDADLTNVDVVTVGGLKACKVVFTSDYGLTTGLVNQTQYYIVNGNTTYIITITVKEDDSNFYVLDQIAQSFTVE